MLDLFQVHGGFTLDVKCVGDKQVDMHHSIEDIGIVFGETLVKCLGDKKGIERYGFYFVPMDGPSPACAWTSATASVSSGASSSLPPPSARTTWTLICSNISSKRGRERGMNLHVELFYGDDNHHCLEAIFKAFARAVAMAVGPSRRIQGVPSSKGVL